MKTNNRMPVFDNSVDGFVEGDNELFRQELRAILAWEKELRKKGVIIE